jgi:hypothetical protein
MIFLQTNEDLVLKFGGCDIYKKLSLVVKLCIEKAE